MVDVSAETPLVRRAVRTGGLFLAVAAAQFVIVALWVGSRLSHYDLWTGSAGALASAGSPWGMAYDASLILLGVLSALGLLFAWSAFDERPSRGIGLFVLLLAAVAATCVGAFDLYVARLPTHSVAIATYVALGAAGAGLLVVAFAMHRSERWRISRAYTFATGVAVLAALALYAHPMMGLVPGTLERVAVAAAMVWAVVEGLHIALLHRFAPGLQVKVAAA